MDQVTKDYIQYGSTVINYDIKFVQRKTLGIWVNFDGTVSLRAPIGSSLEQIRQKIYKRGNWILQQKRYFDSFGIPTTERQYVSGESHLYLGRQYMLRVKMGNSNAVHYQSNIIEIECRKKNDAGILLQTWYRQRANIKFQEYALPIIEKFSGYGVKPQSFSIKSMEKRWGYCTIDGHIFLNPKLICAPKCCIEYVITHELCHLVYRSHSREFYMLLTKEMPHWKKWKNKLERMMM